MVTAEQFAEELAELVLRASPHLPARAIMEMLREEAVAQEGEIIKQQLAAGPWPPDKRPED
jgi:hypothetical protein